MNKPLYWVLTNTQHSPQHPLHSLCFHSQTEHGGCNKLTPDGSSFTHTQQTQNKQRKKNQLVLHYLKSNIALENLTLRRVEAANVLAAQH